MFNWAASDCPDPVDHVRVDHVPQPSVEQYLALYNGVGESYLWTDRNRMEKQVLEALVQSPGIVIHQLIVDQRTAGFSELDARNPRDIEVAYFGLFPDFIGRGLGKYFLTWTLRYAWSLRPRRVWVHTCDLDHPAALPTYLKAGFEVFHTEQIDQPL
jgi:GNAT superfamily N-acetyltransferase